MGDLQRQIGDIIQARATACTHRVFDVVANAAGEPVRMICPSCGRNWRVLPDHLKVTVAAEGAETRGYSQ